MEEESSDGSVEQEVHTPPPSVVVGAFASPGGQVAPLLSGQVATPGGAGGVAASPYGVMAGVQPKLSFKDWFRQLISTNNGRFKLLLVGTIISLMTVVPIFMEFASGNGDYHRNGGTEIEEKVTIEGVEMKVTSWTGSAEIDQIEWLDVELKDGNCWHEQEYVQDSHSTQADGETWYELQCHQSRHDGNNQYPVVVFSVAWLAVDDADNLLFAHEDEYARGIEYETNAGEGLATIADFLPVVGCLLIPISIIGIFVTRHEKSPAQLVH
jgi:hypothetical protein